MAPWRTTEALQIVEHFESTVIRFEVKLVQIILALYFLLITTVCTQATEIFILNYKCEESCHDVMLMNIHRSAPTLPYASRHTNK